MALGSCYVRRARWLTAAAPPASPFGKNPSGFGDEIGTSTFYVHHVRVEEMNVAFLMEMQTMRNAIFERIGRFERNLKRLTSQPAFQIAATRNAPAPVPEVLMDMGAARPNVAPVVAAGLEPAPQVAQPAMARLCDKPKDLWVLWQEYYGGLPGRKAANMYTSAERDANKFKYGHCKPFWLAVSGIVRAGKDAHVVVYSTYGQDLGVSAILKRFVADKKLPGGFHANFLV